MFDLLIKNGYIIDGSGQPRYKSDIGINGEKIVFIGDSNNKDSKRVIDASGLIVAPGFIDAVSYTHLTLPTKRMCRSRWSPYH